MHFTSLAAAILGATSIVAAVSFQEGPPKSNPGNNAVGAKTNWRAKGGNHDQWNGRGKELSIEQAEDLLNKLTGRKYVIGDNDDDEDEDEDEDEDDDRNDVHKRNDDFKGKWFSGEQRWKNRNWNNRGRWRGRWNNRLDGRDPSDVQKRTAVDENWGDDHDNDRWGNRPQGKWFSGGRDELRGYDDDGGDDDGDEDFAFGGRRGRFDDDDDHDHEKKKLSFGRRPDLYKGKGGDGDDDLRED